MTTRTNQRMAGPPGCRHANRLPRLVPVALLALAGLARAISPEEAALKEALDKTYDRCTSRVMVRVLERTDRASLDAVTHERNTVFHYPMQDPVVLPAGKPVPGDFGFDGVLVPESLADSAEKTGLTTEERALPFAWRPLMKYLTEWNYDETEGLLDVTAAVSEPRWGNTDHVRPLQEIAAGYLHGGELWVRVDFRPELADWVPFADDDGDGYPEAYARVVPSFVKTSVTARIREDYAGKALPPGELPAYFHALASDWYPSLMTVVLEPEESRPWPGPGTEPEVRALLQGGRFKEPVAVLRSKPFGTTLYAVFLTAAGVDAPAERAGATAAPGGPAAAATGPAGPVGPSMETVVAGELARWGGSWEAWSGQLAGFHGKVRELLDGTPAGRNGLIGRDGFLFFRGDVELLLSGDLRDQPQGRDPFPAIVDFSRQLREKGIDSYLVVIPTKTEVYPDKLVEGAPDGAKPYVAPYVRKLVGELSAAGVDCIDLLPEFVRHRDDGEGLLYMPQDTHWTPRGLELAARLIAERVKAGPGYDAAVGARATYTTRPAECVRLGDICPMLSDAERKPYRPMTVAARQVLNPDGTPYTDSPDSPVVVLGDSFTGVFQLEDCRHAGLSAHLARELGMPVDLIMAHGSGPQIRIRLARRGAEAVASKRVVIWTVVARDLYRYRSPWVPVPLP